MVHCPTCAAGLRFDIESQAMKCDHCGNSFDVDSLKDRESADAKGHESFELFIFTCPDCGAELAVSDQTDAVGFCPYCGGASMLFDRIRKDWVPDEVIPFKVTKEQCAQAYTERVRKNPFVSGKYGKPELVESFRGIYMPYWRFEGHQNGEFKIRKDEYVGSGEDRRHRIYDRYYKTDYKLTGASHDASSNFDDHTSERLAPYDDEDSVKFHPGYISGFYAEISDMDAMSYERYITEVFRDFTVEQLDDKPNEEERREIPVEITSLSNVLYPVWFMSYRDGKKLTYAAVNGQTGKISADLPLSPFRIIGFAAILSALVFAVLAGLMGLLPSLKASSVLALCSIAAFVSACLLSDSIIGTLRQSVDAFSASEGRDGLFAPSYPLVVFLTAMAILGAIFLMTDGSYKKDFFTPGIIMCGISFFFLIKWAFSQLSFERKTIRGLAANATLRSENQSGASHAQLMSSRASQLENGIIDTYLHNRLVLVGLVIAIFLVCVIAAFMGFLDFPNKAVCYGMCGILGTLTLLYALAQIAFQTAISRREPPQMKKRGALYDEK